MSRRLPLAGLLAGLSAFAATGSARAWEPETHVGLSQRAVQRSGLDAALRQRGLDAGLHEILGLRPDAHAGAKDALGDRELLAELALVDPALGASPDGARASALTWLVAGSVLEGARIERLRNHFVDTRRGGGLDERERYLALRVRLAHLPQGLGRSHGSPGQQFDGSGQRADRWADAPIAQNPLSRTAMLEALHRAQASATPSERGAALARALICTGAVLHVLEAVGAPAHAHGDFVTNYTIANRPVERWAQRRYGLLPPAPTASVAPRTQLARFFTSPDGTGLADEVSRAYASPGTRPTPGAAPSPKAIAAEVDALLPRVAAEGAALLDFLFRGSLELGREEAENGPRISARVGSLALGKGELELYAEDEAGTRQRVLARSTQGGPVGHTLLVLEGNELQSSAVAGARKLVVVYRGVDAAGEPIVLSQALAR